MTVTSTFDFFADFVHVVGSFAGFMFAATPKKTPERSRVFFHYFCLFFYVLRKSEDGSF